MTQNGKGKKPSSGIVIRVSTQTKNRLDKLRHPGQSYEGFLEELLNFWEENHAAKGGFQVQFPAQQPAKQSPDGQLAETKAGNPSWWWWPQVDKVPGDGD